MPRPAMAVSAPGKVLLAGGYLVLDRQHSGLVFALDARIHVLATPLDAAPTRAEIIVRSPQFRDAEWHYGCRLTEGRGVAVAQLKG
jgi:phosphomevalonate kinase